VTVRAQVDPRHAGDFQPSYPPPPLREEVTGCATARVLIGVDGRGKSIEMVSATDPRFRPATRDGVAIESWRAMNVPFRMQG